MTDQPSGPGSDLIGIGKIGVQLIQSAEKFADKLFGPYLSERGEMLADRIRLKRQANLATVGRIAQDQLRDIEVQRIPDRILIPLIEAAANEDLPELQSMWGSLLATAATDSERTPPAFPKILAELSVLDAHILNYLFDLSRETGRRPTQINALELMTRVLADLPHDQRHKPFMTSLSNLARLDLIVSSLGQLYAFNDAFFHLAETYLTPYGHSFIAACRPATDKDL